MGHKDDFSVPKKCFTLDQERSNDDVQVLQSDIEYWYCIGENNAEEQCARVSADLIGYNPSDRNSLLQEHYCSRLIYDIQINVTATALDVTQQFVLDYIRDPVDEDNIDQFFDPEGKPRNLKDKIIWAICDENELGEVDYAECFNRMEVNPEPRVLEMSFGDEERDFSLAFGLQELDYRVVSDDSPLWIDQIESKMFLFHALYTGTDYEDCSDSTQCTQVDTTNWNVFDHVANPAVVTNNYWVAIRGDMPEFDPSPARNMKCDEFFCTLVWIINFEAKAVDDDGVVRRLSLSLEIPFKLAPETPGTVPRLLQESATQSRATRVTAIPLPDVEEPPTDKVPEGEPEGPIDPVIIAICIVGGVALVTVGIMLTRRRKNKTDTNKAGDMAQDATTSTKETVTLV